ncbi:MAG: acyltransferase [Siphonobacter sp.]
MLRKLFSLEAFAEKRIFGLDLLRAIAILIVVDAHTSALLGKYYVLRFWRPFVPGGVELFFVLSGFLIGGIIIKIYETSPHYTGKQIFNFWVRRWFRTLPAYYLVLSSLIIYEIIRALPTGNRPQVPYSWTLAKYFVFTQNFSSPVPGFFPESWSLSIEEWSYLTLPIILWIFHIIFPASWPRRYAFLSAVLSIILFTNGYRLFYSLQIPLSAGELHFKEMVISRLDCIMYGVLAAYVKFYFPVFWTKPSTQKIGLYLGLFWTAVGAVSASLIMLKYYVEWDIYPYYTFYKRIIYFPLVSVSASLLFPYLDSWKTSKGILPKVITHISLISYSMYLINLTPVIVLIVEKIPTTSEAVGWGKVLLTWLIVLSVSTLLYKYFEVPFTKLREHFKPKRRIAE